MGISVDDLVPAIRAMWQAETGRTCRFHLAACAACDGPSFQQPCPNCRAYPDASESRSVTQGRREAAQRSGVGSRDAFVASVERAGGIGAWYFATYRSTVAYQGINREPPDLGFRDAIEGLVERARDVPWPSPGEVWDRVSGKRQPLHSDFRAQDEEWDRMAAETHGEDALPALKRKQDGRSWHPWPDNCAEGRDMLRAHGVATLEQLGVPEASPQAGAAASGPGM